MSKNYEKYALFMKALGDETRIRIFDMLSKGELCACNILEDFNITQPTLSYHMKLLCESGLVNARRDGVWMKYSINEDGLDSLKNLFDDIGFKINKGSKYEKEG
ncbi:MAG: ArsR/SmtB family transcription factor [Clostridia bacterium]